MILLLKRILFSLCAQVKIVFVFLERKGLSVFQIWIFIITTKTHSGWTSPMLHEHFTVEKNDPMTAELEHFVDLCKGRETVPRCTGEKTL